MKDIKINNLYRLKHIIRYSNVQRITNENVAEHSFFVAANVIELREQYTFDLGQALLMATVHDYTEIYIDDINHQVKRDFPEVKWALKKAEKEVVKKFSPIVKEAFYLYEAQETIEAKIVKLADVYQCKQYAQHEITLGNSGYMLTVLEESEKLIAFLIEGLKDVQSL